MQELISKPWPWYIAGPLIGLMVPLLLIMGDKKFGVSSTLRQICAACVPAKIPFFQYDWKKETWNLFFVSGIIIGGAIAMFVFTSPEPIAINEKLIVWLQQYGINDRVNLVPNDLVDWNTLFSAKGMIVTVVGGFLIGFGTRYAGGCTSGHSIMGISTLQWPSLVATICFMVGGLIVSNWVVPIILKL